MSSKATINFVISTPDGVKYEDEVQQVTVPTGTGELTLLANHTPIVTTVVPGEITIKKDGYDVHMAVARGAMEVMPGSKIVILADTTERVDDIDMERAELARKRAQEAIKEHEHQDDIQYAHFAGLLERNVNRIKIGNRRLSKKGLD